MERTQRRKQTRALPVEDRRSEPRLEVGCDIAVILLTDMEDVPARGRIRNISGRGLSLALDRPVTRGTAVRIDVEGRMLLGEVVYSEPANGEHKVGVELQHSVTWTRDLLRLHDALASNTGELM